MGAGGGKTSHGDLAIYTDGVFGIPLTYPHLWVGNVQNSRKK